MGMDAAMACSPPSRVKPCHMHTCGDPQAHRPAFGCYFTHLSHSTFAKHVHKTPLYASPARHGLQPPCARKPHTRCAYQCALGGSASCTRKLQRCYPSRRPICQWHLARAPSYRGSALARWRAPVPPCPTNPALLHACHGHTVRAMQLPKLRTDF